MHSSSWRLSLLPFVGAVSLSACGGGGVSGAMPALHTTSTVTSAGASAMPTPANSATASVAPAVTQQATNAPASAATSAATTAPTKAPGTIATSMPTTTPTTIPTTKPIATVAPIATAASNASTAPVATTAPSSTQFPIASTYYTGRTPFHQTAATLMAAGATVDSSAIATNYWAQGLGDNQPFNESAGGSPLYTVHAGDPSYVFQCPEYGGCSAAGMVAHYPVGAVPAEGSDHHLVSLDPVYLQGEIDAWGGYGCSGTMSVVAPVGSCAHPCNLSSGSPGLANCSYGGFTPFSGSGLGNAGNAAGYAYGLFQITAQELLNGNIGHALGIVQSCLDDNGVFPAGRTGSDSECSSSGNASPNASYGEMIHLKNSVNVASLGYSPYCRTIVQALQTYGAYTVDTNGGWGISIEIEDVSNPMYASNNPWTTTIFPSIVAGGDGSGTGTSFSFQSCLQRLPAADIEVVDIKNDGSYQTAARSRSAMHRS